MEGKVANHVALFKIIFLILAISLLPLNLSAEPVNVQPSQLKLILPDSLDPNLQIGPRLITKFELPQQFQGSFIRLATIQFEAPFPVVNDDSSLIVKIYPISTEWSQNGTSWDVPWANHGGDYIDTLEQTYFLKAGVTELNRIDLTKIFRLYSSDTIENFGLIFLLEHYNRNALRALRQIRQEFVNSFRLVIR
jgi:hypothetical protein